MGFSLMDRSVYDQMAALDQRHWWYRARRDVLAALIRRRARPPRGARVLEIGCGTGHNLAMLGQFGEVEAVELDAAARAVAEQRLGKTVMDSPLPQLKDVPKAHYDLIAAFDVIEHIRDDHAAMLSIGKRLKPGGRLVMTVPAHPWMWSAHDVVNHHVRRYSRRRLQYLIANTPLRLEALGYFNSLLFPAAVGERMVSKLLGKDKADLTMPAAPLNFMFEKTFALERHLVGRLALPPGLSLFAIASAT